MRTINELLKLTLKHLEENPEGLTSGLCSFCTELYFDDIINGEEENMVIWYIRENVPNDPHARKGGYYFLPGEIQPRIEYLKHHIKLVKISNYE
jgi:hypothetical protein